MRLLPDVTVAGIVEFMMLNALGDNEKTVNFDGFQPPKGATGWDIDATSADSGFFNAAGLSLVSGRVFTSSDVPGRETVVIINQALAQKFFPGQDPVGRTFRGDTTVYHVIGVMKTAKVRSLGEAPRPFFFLAATQVGSPIFMLVARTHGDAARTTTRMVAALRDYDPSLMIIQAKTMQTHLAVMLLPARLGAVAFALFAGLALSLAAIGVYGVVRYAVARRAKEVAIRLAIGAQPDGVVRLLMREGLVLVSVGSVLGLILAALASRGLESLLFGVTAADPVALTAAPVLLLAIGALAAFLPARRASRVDPASVMRAE
jgi:ABC-type antimicrobial peptide transport system permease subunit